MNSASLCSLAGRYENPIPPRCLAPIDFLKIPAPTTNRRNLSIKPTEQFDVVFAEKVPFRRGIILYLEYQECLPLYPKWLPPPPLFLVSVSFPFGTKGGEGNTHLQGVGERGEPVRTIAPGSLYTLCSTPQQTQAMLQYLPHRENLRLTPAKAEILHRNFLRLDLG
jgi:hypothetical protein